VGTLVLGLIGIFLVVFVVLVVLPSIYDCLHDNCLVRLFPRCCPTGMDAVERANAARAPPIHMEEYHFGPPPHLQADAVTPKFVIQVSDFVLIFCNLENY
jgi:hypothetical protein